MSDTHNKLQYGNNYNHWKMLHLVKTLIIFLFLTHMAWSQKFRLTPAYFERTSDS